ncbi:MAG: hypothetical protein HUJ75_07915 [Parasporobacterium sp.]|nr:hypothetical protein [Parasporobacterium sp.]
MKERRTPPCFNIFISIMVLAFVTVTAFLCAASAGKEQAASALTKASVWASSAADCYYSADSLEELSQILEGTVEGANVKAHKDGLDIVIETAKEGNLSEARLTVFSGEKELISMELAKAIITEGGALK